VIALALGALWYSASGDHPPPAQAADQLQVSEPVAHDNLAVFFVRGPDEVDTTRVVTLQEALERNLAVVHETGQVNTLVVENLSPDCDLFVQSGDIIKGGRQDRMIASDLLLAPSSGQVPVRAHCVEHDRWVGRGTEAATHFAVSNTCAVGNSLKIANAAGSQSAVWANVKDNQDKLSRQLGCPVNAAASPSSLQLALENPAVQAKVDEYRQALRSAGGAKRVVGAVFVVNGKVTSAEVYGSNLLFRKAWPKLLKSAAIEALAEKGTRPVPGALAVRDVEAFLAMGGPATATRRGDSVDLTNTDPSTDLTNTDPSIDLTNTNRTIDFNGIGLAEPIVVAGPVGLVNRSTADFVTVTAVAGAPVNALERQAGGQPLAGRGDISNNGRQDYDALTLSSSAPAQWRSLQSSQVQRLSMRLSFDPAPQIVHPNTPHTGSANRINTNQVQTESALMLESRDAGQKVIHRSYIKK
jgi:hypothetical protein